MDTTHPLAVARCNHVGLVVSDLDASEAFYREVGCEPVTGETIDFNGPWLGKLVGHEDVQVLVKYLRLGDLVIELIRYVNPPGEAARPRGTHAIGGAHIAVDVDDIGAFYRTMTAAGHRFVSPPVEITNGDLAGTVVVYSYDPDGNVCELVSTTGVADQS
jgi:catechol 2,3-dioxygenase-like lactoylglutathione lyase family enzyme